MVGILPHRSSHVADHHWKRGEGGGARERERERERAAYPEIDVKVAGAAELPVADLESDGHLVILVQLLMETLAAVRGQLDVVGQHGRRQQTGQQY